MDFSKLVIERRTVHSYRQAAVSEADVVEALNLSLWSMNHKLTFPWVYISVGPEARQKIADLAVRLKSAKEPLNEIKTKATRDTVLNPSHFIALGLKLSGNPSQEHEDYATLASSVQIAALALWQKGIATKWSTGGMTKHAETYQILGVNPAEVRLEGALMIGVPASVPPTPQRPDIHQVLRKTT